MLCCMGSSLTSARHIICACASALAQNCADESHNCTQILPLTKTGWSHVFLRRLLTQIPLRHSCSASLQPLTKSAPLPWTASLRAVLASPIGAWVCQPIVKHTPTHCDCKLCRLGASINAIRGSAFPAGKQPAMLSQIKRPHLTLATGIMQCIEVHLSGRGTPHIGQLRLLWQSRRQGKQWSNTPGT